MGLYNAEAALKATLPKEREATITEPLNLYKKPVSMRPEVNDSFQKPFGADVKGFADIGSK